MSFPPTFNLNIVNSSLHSLAPPARADAAGAEAVAAEGTAEAVAAEGTAAA